MNKPKSQGRAFEHKVVAHATNAGLKAKRQPGSGVHKEAPKDVVIYDPDAPEAARLNHLLVEAKWRTAAINPRGEKSLTLSLDWYRSVQAAAAKEGYSQGFVVVGPKGDRKPLALVDLDWLLSLFERARLVKPIDAPTNIEDNVSG